MTKEQYNRHCEAMWKKRQRGEIGPAEWEAFRVSAALLELAFELDDEED